MSEKKRAAKKATAMTRFEKSILAGIWGASLAVALAVLFYAQSALATKAPALASDTIENNVTQHHTAKLEVTSTEGVTITRESIEEDVLMDSRKEDDVIINAGPTMTPIVNDEFITAPRH